MQRLCSISRSPFHHYADNHNEYVCLLPNDLYTHAEPSLVIVSLRCYALYNRSRWVLVCVLSLGIAVLGSFFVRSAMFRPFSYLTLL